MDRGSWRATVHGVPKSRTWLKWLSTHTREMFTSCSYALDIGMIFVSTRNWETNHHKLCWDQRVSETLSIQAPLLFRVCAQLPLQFRHCVSQSTVVHSRVWLLDWVFLQVEGGSFCIICGFKTFVGSLVVGLHGFKEELWTFSKILDIPEKIRVPRDWISAVYSHRSPFWTTHLAIHLGHWVSMGLSWANYKKKKKFCVTLGIFF